VQTLAGAGPVAYDFFNYAVNATGAIVGNVAVGGAGGDAVFGSALYGGVNPVKTAKLQLNAHDRFSQRDGKYFNQVQPYQHHTNMPVLIMYSFAPARGAPAFWLLQHVPH
jgi:hypothetical protein